MKRPWSGTYGMSKADKDEIAPKPEAPTNHCVSHWPEVAPTECELCGFSGHECDCPEVVSLQDALKSKPPKDAREWSRAQQLAYEEGIMLSAPYVEKLERELAARNAELELLKRGRDNRIKDQGKMAGQLWEERAKSAALIEALKPVAGCGNCGGCRDNAREALAKHGRES